MGGIGEGHLTSGAVGGQARLDRDLPAGILASSDESRYDLRFAAGGGAASERLCTGL